MRRSLLISSRSAGATWAPNIAQWPAAVGASPGTLAGYPGPACPTLVGPSTFDPDALPPAERRFFARGAALYPGYFARDPRFDEARLREPVGRTCPPVDPSYRRRLAGHALRAGFIRPRDASGL